MIKEPHVPLFEMVMCLSNAMDLIDRTLVAHHKQVAYVALSIAAEMGLPLEEQNDLILAGLLHDIGALSLQDRLNTLQFEIENPYEHAELGYLLLKEYEPFSRMANLVRYHHTPWDERSSTIAEKEGVPIGSRILHLADRVSVLINKEKEVIGQIKGIRERIEKHAGKMFMPVLVDTFRGLSEKEYFWLDTVSPSLDLTLAHRSKLKTIEMDLERLLDLSRFFCHVIDFRSRFTSTHSSGVAAVAEALAGLIGFSERECSMMKIAGYLHDLGKLAVSKEILEKQERLTEDDVNVIKGHTFYTYRILETIRDMDVINTWASFHHERLDGKGYPFHHKGHDLSLGSRIMAVADVFTAITEDRPYRKAMSPDRALQVVHQMAENSALDTNVVAVLRLNFDRLNSIRMSAQAVASRDYEEWGTGAGVP